MQDKSQAIRTWRRRLIYLALAFGGMLCVFMGLFAARRTDPLEAQVKELVNQPVHSMRLPNQPFEDPRDSTLTAIQQLGPKAYPTLARLIRSHDTRVDELYDWFRGKMPANFQRLLPPGQSKDDTHRRVQGLIADLGPVACRALVGAINDGLAHEKSNRDMELLRALYWSIPESPKAVATLHDWLAKPERHRMLFGWKDSDEIWPQVPQLAPLLLPWLKIPDQARETADALGAMGTNAAFAVGDLIDTYKNGVAGHPPNTNLVIQYAPKMDPLTWNRGAALQALGKIGVASPAVLEILAQAWIDVHPDVRAQCADAVGGLGFKALPVLPRLLEELDTTNRLVLEYQIEAIGKMGPGARQAIPALRHWSDSNAVANLPTPPPFLRAIRWFDDPLLLPAGAAVALFRIAPEEAKGLGNVIAEGLKTGYGHVDRLRELRPLAVEIVQALEPSLQESRSWISQLTALQILCLQPEHTTAKSVLLAAMKEGEPDLRAQAAYYFWQVTGDAGQVLPVIHETLAAVREAHIQGPLNCAAAIGPAAKPIVSQLQVLLTNDDRFVRLLSGKALRRIDPSALPPINEGYP